jgi:hypothetical protein
MAEVNDRRTGWPRKTTPMQDRALVRSSERDRFKTAPQLRTRSYTRRNKVVCVNHQEAFG